MKSKLCLLYKYNYNSLNGTGAFKILSNQNLSRMENGEFKPRISMSDNITTSARPQRACSYHMGVVYLLILLVQSLFSFFFF